ncbi:MAG: hypothetical protein ABI321_08945 [Polyangia bacterium]
MGTFLGALAICGLGACDTNREIGQLTIDTHTVNVTLEGSGDPGKKSNYAIKPVAGTFKPDAVQCGWGTSDDDATQVAAEYDTGDGDFDCAVLRSADGTGALWIALTYDANTTKGSIAVP